MGLFDAFFIYLDPNEPMGDHVSAIDAGYDECKVDLGLLRMQHRRNRNENIERGTGYRTTHQYLDDV